MALKTDLSFLWPSKKIQHTGDTESLNQKVFSEKGEKKK